MRDYKNLVRPIFRHANQIIRTYEERRKTSHFEEVLLDGPEYCLPETYRSRAVPGFDNHTEIRNHKIVWQPDVYALAAMMGRVIGAKGIVDIGCGHAEKLTALHPEFEVVGVDIFENVLYCKNQYHFGSWLVANLEKEIPKIPEHLKGNSVVICSDVIEHIVNARPFAEKLSELIKMCSIGVISTPNRDLIYCESHLGPPINKNHVREWNLSEFQKFLSSVGLETWTGGTRSNDHDWNPSSIIVIAK